MAIDLWNAALCTPDDVKALLRPREVLSTQWDEALIFLINAFSRAMEGPRFLNRALEYRERTDTFHGGTTYVRVQAPPIDRGQLLEVWDDPGWTFDPESALILNSDFYLSAGDAHVVRAGTFFQDGLESVRVHYVGGLVDHANERWPPDDLRSAAAMQVAFWHQRRETMGLTQVNAPGGGAFVVKEPSQLLPWVTLAIQTYRIFECN